MAKMKAAVFVEPGRIVLDEKPIPEVGPLDALVRVTTTTICGTDVHILKCQFASNRGSDALLMANRCAAVGIRESLQQHSLR
jgi:threonine dehydrogenase-like Zn-dependent dehydrogenase